MLSFHCFGPKPPLSTLPPLEAAAYHILKDARGMFKAGMRPAELRRRLADLGVKVDGAEVRYALRRLGAKGLATRKSLTIMPARGWRVA